MTPRIGSDFAVLVNFLGEELDMAEAPQAAKKPCDALESVQSNEI